jgi:4-diphosphocytidyl-2-C-methyl-D-erythritol kinase
MEYLPRDGSLMLSLRAPAKINLTLEVLGKRNDGFHEIRSVFQTIDLSDTLRFQTAEHTAYHCDIPGWQPEYSLVSRAVAILQEHTRPTKNVEITIEKQIPLMSGLGGDSSNAAAVIYGLNQLWELDLAPEVIFDLATRLGSDVPFFLHGRTVLASGRGEIITPLPSPAPTWIVLVFPGIPSPPGKTRQMYAALKSAHYTNGSITQRLADSLRTSRPLEASLLFNTFENVAFDKYPGLTVYKEHLLKLGAPRVHLTGSGPTLFTLFDDKITAADFLARCRDQNMKSVMVPTL